MVNLCWKTYDTIQTLNNVNLQLKSNASITKKLCKLTARTVITSNYWVFWKVASGNKNQVKTGKHNSNFNEVTFVHILYLFTSSVVCEKLLLITKTQAAKTRKLKEQLLTKMAMIKKYTKLLLPLYYCSRNTFK